LHAYITLLSTESYLPGVFALHESLKRTGTPYPFATAVSAHIPREFDDVLERAGIIVRRIPESTAIPKDMIENNGHWGRTFDKVHLFGLSEFEKLVYVDSDMIVLENMDELFDKPHMSAVPAGLLVHKDWTRLNGGLLVIEPEDHLADGIFATLPQALAEVAAMGVTASGDQDLLNAYYPHWRTTPELRLDQGYNMFQCYLDLHIEEHGFHLPHKFSKRPGEGGQRIKIVHFIGPRKPWMKGAVIRQYWRLLKNRGAVKWEHKLFSEYKKLLDDSRPEKYQA
jgi:glycogenin